MALVVRVELLTGGYDAADVADRERAEWPPHPARLYCALVAAVRGDQDRAALRWLEAQEPPLVQAAAQPREQRRQAYVVTNSIEKESKSQTHPGRTNGLWARTKAFPADPIVAFVWPNAAAPEHVAALDAMARRVPYLGRSTGVALATAYADQDGAAPVAFPRPGGPGEVYEPCEMLQAELSVRVPYPGFLDDLDGQFAAGRPAWEVARYCGYRRRREHRVVERLGQLSGGGAQPSVYRDVVVFRFGGLKPQARLGTRFTEALRSAVLRAAGANAPAVLHGHGAPGRPHVAFLAMPDVGHDNADGHLLGLAVAVPEIDSSHRQAVLRAVLGLRREDVAGVVDLRVRGIGEVEMVYQPPGPVRPWGAAPERWLMGSQRWVTATPMVLDRYPKGPVAVEAEVLSSLRTVGLPDPVELQVSAEPLLAGAARLRPGDLPEHVRGRLFRHVAVRFPHPVSGPVIAGAARYLGVGLFAPVPNRGSDD